MGIVLTVYGNRGRFIDYLLERPDVSAVWEPFTKHKFVAGLGDGTLPVEKFKGYLIQDYLYLVSTGSHGILNSWELTSKDPLCTK